MKKNRAKELFKELLQRIDFSLQEIVDLIMNYDFLIVFFFNVTFNFEH